MKGPGDWKGDHCGTSLSLILPRKLGMPAQHQKVLQHANAGLFYHKAGTPGGMGKENRSRVKGK